MSIDLRDPRLREIIDPAAAIETLGDDFQFTEGPIWHPHAKHVTFSDIPANKLFRWSQVHGFAVYRDPSNMTNGNTYDGLGRMLSCDTRPAVWCAKRPALTRRWPATTKARN